MSEQAQGGGWQPLAESAKTSRHPLSNLRANFNNWHNYYRRFVHLKTVLPTFGRHHGDRYRKTTDEKPTVSHRNAVHPLARRWGDYRHGLRVGSSPHVPPPVPGEVELTRAGSANNAALLFAESVGSSDSRYPPADKPFTSI